LAAREGDLDAVESEVTDSVRRLADEVRLGVNAAMKGLRADLASAARDAKSDSRGAANTAHIESAKALHEADMVLNEFRQQMRADLRTTAYRAALPADTVTELKRQLADVRAGILASLGR
jgi:hypothetical protein